MKSKHIWLLTVIISVLIMPFAGRSQGALGLKIIAMPGFPVIPQDSVYEGQSYTFDILLVNNSGATLNTPIDINFRVDSISGVAFTVAQPVIGVNDTATFTITGYNFNQPQFKLGNNIVVVWPVVNGLSIPVDTFYAEVYFIPLTSLDGNSLDKTLLGIYPVPSHSDLYLKLNSNDIVEYVRIYTMEGRLVAEQRYLSDGNIDIRHLRKGTYILEALVNGKLSRARFLKQ